MTPTLPERLDGKRCAIVAAPAAAGALWEQELLRRGAGEVVQVADFEELDPIRTGHFDVVVLDRVLGGLGDPVRALERARSVCAGWVLVIADVDRVASLRWSRRPVARLDGEGWSPNRAAVIRMVESAGFTVEEASRIELGSSGRPRLRDLRGTPFVAVRGRPA